jgi:competence ComEA-like helix-hairpin-helix protein
VTRDEVQALAFVAFLVALSAAVRVWTRPGEPSLAADVVSLEALAGESQDALDESEARDRPLADGERLDPNRAAAADLDRLPGVGPATADRIVAARDSAPFATPDDLLRVRGVGPATLEKIRPFLDPAAFPRAPPRTRTRRERAPLPDGGALPAAGASPDRKPAVDVNRAGTEALEGLPGIGPALARRVVAHRDSAGPFRTADDLLAVRGIGPATLERLRDRIRFR